MPAAHAASRGLIGRTWQERGLLLLLLTCRLLRALPALIVSCEAEHVCEIFAELSRPGKAPLSDTRGPCARCRLPGGIIVGNRVIARVNDIILTVVEALRAVLCQHRWVGGRRRRDHRCIVRYARQMTRLGRIQTAKARLLRRVHTHPTGTVIACSLLFG